MIEVHRFNPHGASRSEWRRFHAYRRRLADENDPGEPVLADVDHEYELKHEWPLYETIRHIGVVDDEIVGHVGLSFRRRDTPDYEAHAPHLYAWGSVVQARRRQGIATALLHPLLGFMRERGKTLLSCDAHLPAGQAFLAAIGGSVKHSGVENRLSLTGLDWAELDRWQTAASAPGSSLHWELHAGRVELARLEMLMPQFSLLIADVPIGRLNIPPLRFTMAAYQTRDQEIARRGGGHFLVLLMDGETVAAMCEGGWDARFPDRVYQELTAVARSHRGRGLAKSVKAAMLRLVRDNQPRANLMITYNADANAPMLSINRRLGFVVHRRTLAYQLDRDTLAAWLSAR